MPTAAQLKALVRSHAEGDNQRFYSVALQVAAQAARQGHGKFAQDLRELIDRARAGDAAVDGGQRARPVPVVQPRGELAGLLTAAYPKTRLSDMSLDKGIRTRIERVLTEQRQRTHLQSHGLSPQRRLLLVGPPGTGKTMTAAALAGELSLPLFSIQLHSLITKYLGETAAKLRLIFDAMRETRAVYLFDEFDALGTDRASKNEVGEIRRVLNSFLQFLEHDDSDSVIVSATNHPTLLDRALLRRFDAVIEYKLPTPDVALQDPDYEGWTTVARAGELSPWSATGVTMSTKWPNKPDVVCEGGNIACDGQTFDGGVADLGLLSTFFHPQEKLFVSTNATSASTAQVARMGAMIMAEYPTLWPQTVRALLVHAAHWTCSPRFIRTEAAKRASCICTICRGQPTCSRILRTSPCACA